MRRLGAVCLLTVVATVPAAAQVHSSVSARTRYLDRAQGWTSSSLWLGLDVGLERPDWGFHVGATGSPATHRSWSGQSTAIGRVTRPLGSALSFVTRFDGGLDRTLRGGVDGEGWVRAGVERSGPLSVGGGFAGFAGSRISAVGGFGVARVRMGGIQLDGEVGQMATFRGSLVGSGLNGRVLGSSTPVTASTADTSSNVVGSVRRVGHFVLGGKLERGWLEVSGRMLRRTRLTYGDGNGWELGVGVQPVSGVMFQLQAGRAPIGPTIYLPFRNQLSFGVSLANRRPRRSSIDLAPMAPVGARFEMAIDQAGQTLRVRHPRASKVELVGDFSNWRPITLSRVDQETWELGLRLAPGVYLVNLVVDGGALEVPSGLTETKDEFGGRAGVLIIPAAR